MLCEAVKSYLANAKGVPFFYAVGDENYNQILSELKQNSVIVDRISDFALRMISSLILTMLSTISAP